MRTLSIFSRMTMCAAIAVQAGTNFVGCYVGMWAADKFLEKKKNET